MRLHRHRWQVRGVQHVTDVSFGLPGIPRTDVLRRCARCGRLKRKSIDGTWTATQLLGSWAA